MRVHNEIDALEASGVDTLRMEFMPRIIGGVVSVLALTAITSVLALMLAYLAVYGFQLWSLPAFTRVIPDLNRYVLRQGKAGVWVVSTASTNEVQNFMWQWGPAFELRQAPAALLRPLYRRLPRSFEVQDGMVTATIDGVPPGLSGIDHASLGDEED